jgi:hypothetical protein
MIDKRGALDRQKSSFAGGSALWKKAGPLFGHPKILGE